MIKNPERYLAMACMMLVMAVAMLAMVSRLRGVGREQTTQSAVNTEPRTEEKEAIPAVFIDVAG